MAPHERGGSTFSVRITRTDATADVSVHGAIDLGTAAVLRSILAVLVRDANRVVVDLDRTSHLDGHSIGMLVATQRDAARNGNVLQLRRAHGRVRRVLEITGADKMIVEPDELAPAGGQDRTAETLLTARQRHVLDVETCARLRQLAVMSAFDLAGRLARTYRNRGESADDLDQVAMLGLIKAVDGYDAEKGSSFLGYAIPTIRGELRRHFRDKGWQIRVPRRLQELGLDVQTADAELTQVLGRPPTVAELAVHLDVAEAELNEARAAAQAYRPTSLSVPVGGDGVPGGAELGDLIGAADDGFELVEFRESLRDLLPRLPLRERRILSLRFYGNQTQSQIAEQVGVSQMHVSRLLADALRRLRRGLTAER